MIDSFANMEDFIAAALGKKYTGIVRTYESQGR